MSEPLLRHFEAPACESHHHHYARLPPSTCVASAFCRLPHPLLRKPSTPRDLPLPKISEVGIGNTHHLDGNPLTGQGSRPPHVSASSFAVQHNLQQGSLSATSDICRRRVGTASLMSKPSRWPRVTGP